MITYTEQQMKDSVDSFNDRIYELEAKLDKAMAEIASHQWIRVEDRLPEEGQLVLLVTESVDKEHRILTCLPLEKNYSVEDFLEGRTTHYKPIALPKPEPKGVFQKLVDSDKYKEVVKSATFLPKCKWKHNIKTVTFCSNSDNEQYQKPCSKRCTTPEPKEQK
jgi:hypothetical protein